MRGLRRAVVGLMLTVAAHGVAWAGGLSKAERYTVTIDLTARGNSVELDESEVVARCRDLDGCTVWLKIDGPAGIKTDGQRLYLSAFSLAYTPVSKPIVGLPFKDADNHRQLVTSIEVQTPKGTVTCGMDDLDVGQSGDTIEGFSVNANVTAPDLGFNVCVVSIED